MLPLIVVATHAEAERLLDLNARVIVCGVGVVAAALATARALAQEKAGLVISAGIGGAYPTSGLLPGDLAVSSEIIQADLGAWDGHQFLDFAELGLSVLPDSPHAGQFPAWQAAPEVARRTGARLGPMLTLSSVTGSLETAALLETRRFPGALTEGMEGAGIAHAALLAGVPVLEVRGVSNAVGPRDRPAWQIPQALAATRKGVAAALEVWLERSEL
ncbi:futalosine hydrolase [Deinococcus sp. SM5_A1]|uniref:futalosine hydrolase n=1 Tax=Deinococcus sp. SM5_A1 TaxID=3379094 RepID=UPI00385E08A0